MSSCSSEEDEDGNVIIDNGSATVKCGFAGEEECRAIFPNYVGRPKYRMFINIQQCKY